MFLARKLSSDTLGTVDDNASFCLVFGMLVLALLGVSALCVEGVSKVLGVESGTNKNQLIKRNKQS